jgi:hypothetical protein
MSTSGAAKAEAPAGGGGGEGDLPEAKLLVSEFPPPPFYYMEAANLTPPPIPKEALERANRIAAAKGAAARAESERLRLSGDEHADKTDAILGGVMIKEEEEKGEVVGVFGEVVEVRGMCVWCFLSFLYWF